MTRFSIVFYVEILGFLCFIFEEFIYKIYFYQARKGILELQSHIQIEQHLLSHVLLQLYALAWGINSLLFPLHLMQSERTTA